MKNNFTIFCSQTAKIIIAILLPSELDCLQQMLVRIFLCEIPKIVL